jgi:HTH-type transcriptional regulator/antitoxin HipB
MSTRPQTLRTPAQLGLLLQSARKARGMTQSELAARVRLSQSRISQIEKDPAELSAERLLAWCSTLGLELSVARRGAVSPEPDKTAW